MSRKKETLDRLMAEYEEACGGDHPLFKGTVYGMLADAWDEARPNPEKVERLKKAVVKVVVKACLEDHGDAQLVAAELEASFLDLFGLDPVDERDVPAEGPLIVTCSATRCSKEATRTSELDDKLYCDCCYTNTREHGRSLCCEHQIAMACPGCRWCS